MIRNVQDRKWIIHVNQKVSHAWATVPIARTEVYSYVAIAKWKRDRTGGVAVHPRPLSIGFDNSAEFPPMHYFRTSIVHSKSG